MAVSFRGQSITAGLSEGLSEVDRSSGEPENTYILRPVFQQRRVADRARRAMWEWGRGVWERERPHRDGLGEGLGGCWHSSVAISSPPNSAV